MSIRPPDRKIVPPAVIVALPRYPPSGGLASVRQVLPPSADRYADFIWLPAPGSLPQPRNNRPSGAAATATDQALWHGLGTGRHAAEPSIGPASSTGGPRSVRVVNT